MGGHIADFELWYRESDTKDLDYNKVSYTNYIYLETILPTLFS